MSAPTKDSPFGVYVYHNTTDGVSVGVEFEPNGAVTLALAICSPRDNFSKKKAQMILRNRLTVKRFIAKTPMTVPLPPYTGGSFKDDVFNPIIEFIRDESCDFFLRRGEPGDQRSLIRELTTELVESLIEARQSVVV